MSSTSTAEELKNTYLDQAVRKLVEAHLDLAEPMDAAIWIQRDAPTDVWLVEVVPDMADDDEIEHPTCFNPTRNFRFPLCLITGNLADLERATRRSHDFARALVEGEVIYGDVIAQRLIAAARRAIAEVHDA